MNGKIGGVFLFLASLFLVGTSANAQDSRPRLSGKWWGLLQGGYVTLYMDLNEGPQRADSITPVTGRIWISGGQPATLTNGKFVDNKFTFDYVNGVGSFTYKDDTLDGSYTFRNNVWTTTLKRQ